MHAEQGDFAGAIAGYPEQALEFDPAFAAAYDNLATDLLPGTADRGRGVLPRGDGVRDPAPTPAIRSESRRLAAEPVPVRAGGGGLSRGDPAEPAVLGGLQATWAPCSRNSDNSTRRSSVTGRGPATATRHGRGVLQHRRRGESAGRDDRGASGLCRTSSGSADDLRAGTATEVSSSGKGDWIQKTLARPSAFLHFHVPARIASFA